MTISTHRSGPQLSARAVHVDVTDDQLLVELEDGRLVGAPLAWFPRLAAALPEQRDHWKLIGRGVGIHWPDLDEDISVENLLGSSGELLTAEVPVEQDPTAKARKRVSITRMDPTAAPPPTTR